MLVEGVVELVRRVGREAAVVGWLDVPGRWAGGFRAWDEHGVYLATGRGAVEGWLLRVPAAVLAMADLEDELSSWLAGHDVERDWLIAPALAAAGVDVARVRAGRGVLGDAGLGPGLEWVAGTLSVTALLAEVKDSTRRVSGLGLDTARRIVVDRHRGRIDIDSRPGETVLRVRLPAGSGQRVT